MMSYVLLVNVFMTLLLPGAAYVAPLRQMTMPTCRIPRIQSRRRELSMNMMDRFIRVVKGNVNNLLSNMEDPEKVLEQAVTDMQNDLVKIRQNYAEISAAQKRMEKQKNEAETLAGDWYKRAQLALGKGDEALAREALSRRQIQQDIATNLVKQMTMQAAAIEKLYGSMQQLELKISEAKRDKDAMVARAKTAKTSVQVNDLLSNLDTSSSMEAFERMKAKVETLEAQAEVAGELAASSSGSTTVEQRFKALDAGSLLDDELEALKRQLPGARSTSTSTSTSDSASTATPELPAVAQDFVMPPPATKAALDEEYERLKKELGR